MKTKTILTSLALTMLLAGCSTHQFMRGTVAMKTDDSTAHVCLGDNDVKIGDKLDFYNNECTGTPSNISEGRAKRECEMKIIGTGTVTKLLNSHYSEVMTDGSFTLAEGILVQKRQ